MAKAKRLWSSLSDSTKQRYKRFGVSPQQYNSGKISTEFRNTIMGKGSESFAVQRAKQAGLNHIVPEFDSLKKAEKERVADLWLRGMTTPIHPMTIDDVKPTPEMDFLQRKHLANSRRSTGEFNLTPIDTRFDFGFDDEGQLIPNTHYGKALIEPETVHAKMDIEDWLVKIGHGDMTAEDWKQFKRDYTASFTRSSRHR